MIRAGVTRLRAVSLAALLCAGAAFTAAGFWIPIKAEVAQWLLNRAWAATDDDRRNMKPWPWADTWPVARLRLSGADDPLIVLAGASGRNLAFGPVHVEGTAAPGTEGIAVVAGHRDTHFRALQHLHIGDPIEIDEPGGASYRYEVTSIDVVNVEHAVLRGKADVPVVVLVTCYPFDAAVPGGPLRYVVTAVRTSAIRKVAASPAAHFGT